MNFKPGLIVRPALRNMLAAAPDNYVVPVHIDRRSEMLPSSNQGNTSQCVAYAIAGCLEYDRWKRFGNAGQIDPEPIYNLAKKIDGMANEEGTTLEAGLQAATELGLLPELDNRNLRTVNHVSDVKQALHRYGVVLAAFNVRSGWMNAALNGWIPPGGDVLGGHAVVLCGYSTLEIPPWFAIQNSWGEASGWRGFNRLSHDLFVESFDYGLAWET